MTQIFNSTSVHPRGAMVCTTTSAWGRMRRLSASLAVRVLLVFAVATLVPLGVAVLHIRDDVERAEERAYQDAQSVALVAAAALDADVRDARRAADAISRLPAFWDGTPADRDGILRALASSMPGHAGLVYVTDDLRRDGGSDPGGGADRIGRADVEEAATTGRATFAHAAVIGGATDGMILPVIFPVREQAACGRRGFLAALLSAEAMTSKWSDAQLPPGSTLLLIDMQQSRILLGTGDLAGRTNVDVTDNQIGLIRRGVSAFRLVPPHDGVERLRSWSPVADSPWVVAADIPSQAVFGPSHADAARLLGVVLAVAALAFLALFGLWWTLQSRLRALGAAAAHWSRHDWAHRTGVQAHDELGTLAETFDSMADRLGELSVQVEDQLAQLSHQAFYDRLTDLPNRALLKDRLGVAAARAVRRRGHVAVLFLDLDGFKLVNDSLGHDAGDALLVALAERLRRHVRPEDTVARLGGDEFVVLVEEVADESEALAIAERLLDRLAPRYRIDGHDLFAMGSVGVALSRPGADDPDGLLRDADVAMYHAKSRGKGRCAIFEPGMNAHAEERLALETDLRGALDRGEMRVAYQPIVRLESGRIIEVEALLRWDHPTRGPISPAQFIPIAEETGVIVPLGTWVLGVAARQAVAWRAAHPRVPVTMSVNLSARQLQHPALVADVRRIIRDTGLEPKRLKLEVTESAVMHDVDAAVAILELLKTLGIQLAIDDFGTGYSSLAQLRRLPVDVLKIDRAFVNRLEHGPADVAIVRSIMDLAASLDLSVTSEGIETVEQADRLRTLGCTQGQGFLYAHAVSPETIDALLDVVPPVLPDPKTNHRADPQDGSRHVVAIPVR
jgi:diguanylate cyclase (GGDEF)-like protein